MWLCGISITFLSVTHKLLFCFLSELQPWFINITNVNLSNSTPSDCSHRNHWAKGIIECRDTYVQYQPLYIKHSFWHQPTMLNGRFTFSFLFIQSHVNSNHKKKTNCTLNGQKSWLYPCIYWIVHVFRGERNQFQN
mgnify:FL=1